MTEAVYISMSKLIEENGNPIVILSKSETGERVGRIIPKYRDSDNVLEKLILEIPGIESAPFNDFWIRTDYIFRDLKNGNVCDDTFIRCIGGQILILIQKLCEYSEFIFDGYSGPIYTYAEKLIDKVYPLSKD